MKKIIDDLGFNKLIKGRDGYFVYNENDQYVGASLANYGEFSRVEADFFAQVCKPGDNVIEVGANIGAHTVGLAKMVGSQGNILAFEPQRIVFQTLCANISINSLTNVKCFQYAVGDINGQVLVPDLNHEVKSNFGGVSLIINTDCPKEYVQCVTLDSFITLPKLKLLKIDVEGMEANVIKGAQNIIKKLRPIIYTENDRKSKSEEIIRLIMGMDYSLYWHLPQLFNPNNFANNDKDIFGNLVSLNLICFPKEQNIAVQGSHEITNPSEFPITHYK